MNSNQINKIDDLAFSLNFNIEILNSAIKSDEGLEVYMLENFVSTILDEYRKLKDIFKNEII